MSQPTAPKSRLSIYLSNRSCTCRKALLHLSNFLLTHTMVASSRVSSKTVFVSILKKVDSLRSEKMDQPRVAKEKKSSNFAAKIPSGGLRHNLVFHIRVIPDLCVFMSPTCKEKEGRRFFFIVFLVLLGSSNRHHALIPTAI